MGRTSNLCICIYCGDISPSNQYESTCYVKCLKCQKEGKTKLLNIEEFRQKKRIMHEQMAHLH